MWLSGVISAVNTHDQNHIFSLSRQLTYRHTHAHTRIYMEQGWLVLRPSNWHSSGSTHSCHLPKQTSVSCPSVSCCMSPAMYSHWQKPVWGPWHHTQSSTDTHTHIQECCRHFKTTCLKSWRWVCHRIPLPWHLLLSTSSFNRFPASSFHSGSTINTK